MNTTVDPKKFSNPFLVAYLACALWSSNDESTPEGGEPLDRNYDISDIHLDSLLKAVDDCERFKREAGKLLKGIPDDVAGHDFWLTRNGHGAGFWDRGLGELGDSLTKLCKGFGEVTAIIGDDKMVHFE